jgi:hypothetical protein
MASLAIGRRVEKDSKVMTTRKKDHILLSCLLAGLAILFFLVSSYLLVSYTWRPRPWKRFLYMNSL